MDKHASQEFTSEVFCCEQCLKEIPAESEEYFETDEYVRHFCGMECYAKWKQARALQEEN